MSSKPLHARISKQIEKYGLPQSWEKECYDLYEKFLKSRSTPHIGKPTKLIDSILLLLCRKYRFIEPKDLLKATRGAKGSSARKSLHFFRILEELDGVTPATPEDYIRKFFITNPEYSEFLPKALDIASKLSRDFQGKNPRILASACIYVSSIEKISSGYKPLMTQREVATFFKVTEAGIRNVYRELVPKLKDMNTMLSKQEIEWWLSIRKEQLEKLLSPDRPQRV